MLHAVRACLPGPLRDGPAILRGRSDNRPKTNLPAHRRGSYRAKRPVIRPMTTSNASRQRAESML